MILARLFRNSPSPALRTAPLRLASSQLASLRIAASQQHSSVILPSTRPLSRRIISTTSKNLDNNTMTDYSDGVGAWGAWQAEPSRFTQQVVTAMRTLYVDTGSLPSLGRLSRRALLTTDATDTPKSLPIESGTMSDC